MVVDAPPALRRTRTSSRSATSPASQHPFLGTHVRVEHWANALNQPSTAAATVVGALRASTTGLPYFFTDQFDLGHGVRRVRGARTGTTRWSSAVTWQNRELVAFWLAATAGWSRG